MQDVTWFVITKNNYEEAVKRVEELLGAEFVVIALTPAGYESMAYNLQEIRRFIRQQKEIILYYREATDAADEADEWLEKNAELQASQETAPNQEEFTEAITEKTGGFKLPKLFGRD
jgi:plasmid stabilization system protein ParE